MISFPMPFPTVPCAIWLAHRDGQDSYGNEQVTYSEHPDVVTECAYAPGYRSPDTAADIEDARPQGVTTTMTVFLPKTLNVDLRGALLSIVAPDDAALGKKRFAVVGEPHSYMRSATPGQFSWAVEVVAHDG